MLNRAFRKIKGRRNKYIKDCMYRKRLLKKKLKELRKAGNLPELREFYEKKESAINLTFNQYEVALKNWSIIVLYNFLKVKINEDALSAAISFRDDEKNITLFGDTIDTTCSYYMSKHLSAIEHEHAYPFPKLFVKFSNNFYSLKEEYKDILGERNS